ncbi:hypothetical protein E4U55_003878 [Claviceps digitariae]|nr:hypothetical protein E4U55_003878 [Claviceps digitariae]
MSPSNPSRLLAFLALLLALTITASRVEDPADADEAEADAETPAVRTFFYVGGGYADDGNGGHIFREQMYVERLRPVDGVRQRVPVVMIHGQGQTGTNFLNKPDGHPGWASLFLRQGYEVYLVDQTLRARSPWQPGRYAAAPSSYSAELVQQRFTNPKRYMLWPQAALHTQWPGSGAVGDPVFDGFYSAGVPFVNNASYQQSTVREAGAALLDRIGRPVVLLGHSQGGILPMVVADARPERTAGLVLLEPGGPPFRDGVLFGRGPGRAWGVADVPMGYEPGVRDPAVELRRVERRAPRAGLEDCLLQEEGEGVTPRRLVNLAGKDILVVTSESGYHAAYDYCTVAYLRQAGCGKTTHLELGKAGIHGNGHMFFMEKNSDVIQEMVRDWIEEL